MDQRPELRRQASGGVIAAPEPFQLSRRYWLVSGGGFGASPRYQKKVERCTSPRTAISFRARCVSPSDSFVFSATSLLIRPTLRSEPKALVCAEDFQDRLFGDVCHGPS